MLASFETNFPALGMTGARLKMAFFFFQFSHLPVGFNLWLMWRFGWNWIEIHVALAQLSKYWENACIQIKGRNNHDQKYQQQSYTDQRLHSIAILSFFIFIAKFLPHHRIIHSITPQPHYINLDTGMPDPYRDQYFLGLLRPLGPLVARRSSSSIRLAPTESSLATWPCRPSGLPLGLPLSICCGGYLLVSGASWLSSLLRLASLSRWLGGSSSPFTLSVLAPSRLCCRAWSWLPLIS